MPLALSRWLALIFAVVLAVVEALLNRRPAHEVVLVLAGRWVRACSTWRCSWALTPI